MLVDTHLFTCVSTFRSGTEAWKLETHRKRTDEELIPNDPSTVLRNSVFSALVCS